MSGVRDTDPHYLPGMSFELDGETVPARELGWAMISSCGCTAGVHLMTEDTVTEALAWKMMSGNAAKQKRDKARGFTLRMVKRREINFDDCTHTPKWGCERPPTPPGHSWATTSTARTLHLVPLTELTEEQRKEQGREWVEDRRGKFVSICQRVDNYGFDWTRKWYHLDGKTECTRCVKIAERHESVTP